MSGFHGRDESRGTSAGGNPPVTPALFPLSPDQNGRRRVAVVVGKAKDLVARWETMARCWRVETSTQ